MSLQSEVNIAIKQAMKAKDKVALDAFRAIKSAILLANTASTASDSLTKEQELKILQKLVKQRKDSADIFSKQGRNDLAELELAQAAAIQHFLPKPLNEAQIEKIIKEIIQQTNASSMQDMGKVMGIASKKLAGKTDGKTISVIVQKNLK